MIKKRTLFIFGYILLLALGQLAAEGTYDVDSPADTLCFEDTTYVWTPEVQTPADMFYGCIRDGNKALCDSMIAAGFDLAANSEEIEKSVLISIKESLLGLEDAAYYNNWSNREYHEYVDNEEQYLTDIVLHLAEYGFKARHKQAWIDSAKMWGFEKLVYAIQRSITKFTP